MNNATPVRAGVDIMPCLVSQSKNGANSPMTPPTSPQNRSRNQNSGGIRKNSHQNHHSTNKSGGDSDIQSDSIVTQRTNKNNGASNTIASNTVASNNVSSNTPNPNTMRSPRKQFRTALFNGETIDVASNRFDQAKQNETDRRNNDPNHTALHHNHNGENGTLSISEVENNTNNNNASIGNKKKKKKKKKKNKNNNKSNKNNTNTNTTNLRQKRKNNKEDNATSTSSRTSSTNPERTKTMRKRAKKLKDRLKKFKWRKSILSSVSLNVNDEGNDENTLDEEEGNTVREQEWKEEEYDLTWEEGAANSLKKGRKHLYALHTEMKRIMQLYREIHSNAMVDDDDDHLFENETTYQHDGRLLRSILKSLSILIPITSNYVKINRKENGWDNLVKCGGMELLARYAYQGIIMNVTSSSASNASNASNASTASTPASTSAGSTAGSTSASTSTSTTTSNATHDSMTASCLKITEDSKENRRSRSTCLSLLSILIECSTSAAYSLVSTGGILIIMNEGTLSLKRELIGVHDGTYVNDMTIRNFHSNLAITSISIYSTILTHIKESNGGTSLLVWPLGITTHLIEYSTSIGLWNEMNELITQSAASRGGILTETRQQLLQNCLFMMEISVSLLYNELNEKEKLKKTSTSTVASKSILDNRNNRTEIPSLIFTAFAETGIKALLHLIEALADCQKSRDLIQSTKNGKR